MKKWKAGKQYQLIEGCEDSVWWTKELVELLPDKNQPFEVNRVDDEGDAWLKGDRGLLMSCERQYFKRVRKEK